MVRNPGELIEDWLQWIPVGYALDLGAGAGDATLWLADRGFKVDAVERDEQISRDLIQACEGQEVEIYNCDVIEFKFPHERYSVINASAILHFIKPTDLWSIADRLVAALVPGGFLIAEALTTDDPGYEALHLSGQEQIEPNTFSLPSVEGVIHYFEPGELSRIFSSLEVTLYEETRRKDEEDPVGFRAGASLVARKSDELKSQ
jgi:trans-aconitate methyltransferase